MKTTMMVLHTLWCAATLSLLHLQIFDAKNPMDIKLLAIVAFAGTIFCASVVGVWIKRTF